MHVAQKFEHLLDTYRRPDGHRWTGQQLDDATGGVITRSYVTNLCKGRIESPGYEKLAAMAKAMGFPPEVWFDEGLGEGRSIGQAEDSRGLAGRLEHLFEVVRNPKTGEPYTNAEVARYPSHGLEHLVVASPPRTEPKSLEDIPEDILDVHGGRGETLVHESHHKVAGQGKTESSVESTRSISGLPTISDRTSRRRGSRKRLGFLTRLWNEEGCEAPPHRAIGERRTFLRHARTSVGSLHPAATGRGRCAPSLRAA